MDDTPAEGRFDYEGWQLHAGQPRAVQFASAHESHHQQLADSTAWGALTRVLRRLPGDGPRRAVAFNRTAGPVQEAFATWAPAAAFGWTPAQLTNAYPGYLRHWRAMDRAVRAAPGPYLAFHAAHAAARACLQAPAIEPALAAGLDRCTIADLPRRLRPDHRFGLLQREPVDWASVFAAADASLAGDGRWPALRDAPQLTAALFGTGLRALWQTVNELAFTACARQLEARDCPTLTIDGHHEQIRRLLGAVPGVDLSPGDPGAAGTRVALANAEREIYVTGSPLPARLASASSPVGEMITGPAAPHLMLSVRRGTTVACGFDFAGGPAPDPRRAAAHLRRGELHDGGLRVVLRDAENLGPSDVLAAAAAYALVDISLFTAELRSRWQEMLDPARAALVLDVPLADHLPLWLAPEGNTLRYTFLRTEVQDRLVAFLLAEIDAHGPRSHLLVRGISPVTAAAFRSAFEEFAAAGMRIVLDDGVAERHEPMLGLVVAHLAIEERVFGLPR